MHWWTRLSLKLVPFYVCVAKALVHVFYKIDHTGFDKIPERGPVLLIANHISYVDGLIVQAVCKRPVRFVIDQFIYEIPVVHYFLSLHKVIPILPRKEEVEQALSRISELLEEGEVVCVFPEGRLTYTGNLGRFKPGIEWVIDRDPVPIYPIAIKGLWGSIFSRKYLYSKWRWLPRSLRRKVTVICGDYLQRKVLALKNSI
jgi:1-acyl-sn-glycerol-3-phosphate acyltransferase